MYACTYVRMYMHIYIYIYNCLLGIHSKCHSMIGDSQNNLMMLLASNMKFPRCVDWKPPATSLGSFLCKYQDGRIG